jgi:predicted MFS family arabinose efflux permease
MAPSGKKTQGASIIVLGYQGGMISGMAIGSLLVGSVGADGIFLLGTIIALALAAYSATLLPSGGATERLRTVSSRGVLKDFVRALKQVSHDRDFLATMLMIGVPAKAVLTGVIGFALPLLLSARQLAQEDIGQIIMVYAGAVIAASSLISRYVDRTGETASILKIGTALSGVGLVLIGLFGLYGGGDTGPMIVAVLPMPPTYGPSTMIDLSRSAGLSIVMLLVGVAVLGAAHGFINAPVVTHIAQSSLADRIGQGTATASYRFLERIGHIAGPIVVGQFIYASGNSPLSVMWIGVVTILLAIGFAMVTARQRAQQLHGAIP